MKIDWVIKNGSLEVKLLPENDADKLALAYCADMYGSVSTEFSRWDYQKPESATIRMTPKPPTPGASE